MAGVFDQGPEAVRYSWIAVQGVGVADLVAASGLEIAGACGGVPDLGVTELPGDWVAIVDADPAAAFRTPLIDLARLGPAIVLSEDVAARQTEARAYEDGRETWQVRVDAATPAVLSFRGEPPDEYSPLAQMNGEEVFVDTPRDEAAEAYFEIPLLLAAFVCRLQLGGEPQGLRWMQLRRP